MRLEVTAFNRRLVISYQKAVSDLAVPKGEDVDWILDPENDVLTAREQAMLKRQEKEARANN